MGHFCNFLSSISKLMWLTFIDETPGSELFGFGLCVFFSPESSGGLKPL